MSLLYLETSALGKLAMPERETRALMGFLAGATAVVTSALTAVELTRLLLRQPSESMTAWRRCSEILADIAQLALDPATLTRAATLPPPRLRSLDALHLASALSLPDCAGMVTYDRRMIEAAAYHGMQVWSPGA
ncbi:MAG: type II toxin-antitoxin system VapC family toxin [Terriglobales bacterium]